ncbi:MAG: hypothetical protein H7835_03530 [Magnetococcus sp. XQGC-1]
MDYSQLLHELQQATLFDLFRLNTGIGQMLDQPERIAAVKRQLRIGQEITYFDQGQNRLIPAVVEEIQRTRLLVRNKEDGKRWNIYFYMVNLAGVNTDIHPQRGQQRLDRNQLQVGEAIGFRDREHRERYGTILQLNQKTASILTTEGARWRVAYSLLYRVMDGDGQREADVGLIEGEILVEGVDTTPAARGGRNGNHAPNLFTHMDD